MSSSHEHPSLTMRVTPEQRDRAESLLKDVYADGRIDEPEFDSRISQALTAQTRKDLNQAFYGLVEVPDPLLDPRASSARQPPVQPERGQQPGRGIAALAHFSVFFLWLFGPGLVFALSPAESHARREAAKSFNFQLIASMVLVPMYIIAGAGGGSEVFDWLLTLVGFTWFVLTVIGGDKAWRGQNWHNPVTSAVKLKALPE